MSLKNSFYNIKETDHFGGRVFLLNRSSFNFRHPGLLLPKGNYVYDIYPYTLEEIQFLEELHT